MGEEREEERNAGRSRREEEPRGDAQEDKAQREQREAEGDGMEFAGSGTQAEPICDGMVVEAVMMNDEEAWDDVKGAFGKNIGIIFEKKRSLKKKTYEQKRFIKIEKTYRKKKQHLLEKILEEKNNWENSEAKKNEKNTCGKEKP